MKRLVLVALILGALGLAGWYGPGVYKKAEYAQMEDELWERARKRVTSELFDPESAKFDCVFVGVDTTEPPSHLVFGNVNARNRLGAYAGSRYFWYTEKPVEGKTSAGLHDGPGKRGPECETSRFR